MTWRVAAHFAAAPPPNWREWLAMRLQPRPRRIGAWAELALYGARKCLDLANEPTLPNDALLRVGSRLGPFRATRTSIEQSRHELPMPFVFLESQPSQMLAALSRYLAWQGDARFVVSRDKQALFDLTQIESGEGGALIGWVDESGAGGQAHSEWWRFV